MSEKKEKKKVSDREEELLKEVQELQERMGALEDLIGQVFEPISAMRDASSHYFKLVDLYIRYGKISPETLMPEVKDEISKEIILVLFDRNGQNISQITESVKARRGKASRRIVRERLKELEGMNVVERKRKGKIDHFYISDEVIKKWSRVLGLSK